MLRLCADRPSFSVSESDESDASNCKTWKFTVTSSNIPPVAKAGLSHSIPVGSSHTHFGSVTDANSNLVSYDWPPVSCAGACPDPAPVPVSGGSATAPLTFTPSVAGTYSYSLTATDSDGATHTDTMADTAVVAGSTFTLLCSDTVSYWPASPLVDLDPPCDVMVRFSPALVSESSEATITVVPAVGFTSSITFDVIDVLQGCQDCTGGIGPSVTPKGFNEVYNGNNLLNSLTVTSPYPNPAAKFSVEVSKLAADPQNDLFYTVRLRANGGGHQEILDLRLTLRASSPGFGEE